MQCVQCHTPIPDDARFCHSCGSQVSDAEGQAAATAAMDASAFQHMENLLRQEVEGEFEVQRLLGRGGMAMVYLAREVHLDRRVAIKVLPPELTFGHGVERFKREAKTAAALDHPNIIPIYRVGSGGKIFWYAMKYLEGRSLDEVLKEKDRFTLDSAIEILSQVADALDYAHEHQVVHRDIKPANVMLDTRNRVVVTDFGIAKALTEGTLTASGSVIGTPYFMSPEQGMGKPVSGRSDQYSVAVMAYRMISGQVPFEGDSAIDILHKHCMMPPPSMETVWPGLPQHVYRAVHKALAKDPERRFPTVGALVEALRRQTRLTPTTDEMAELATVMLSPEASAAAAASRSVRTASPDAKTELVRTPASRPAGPARPAKRGAGRRVAAVFAAVLIVGLSAAGTWWMLNRGDGAAPAAASTDAAPAGAVAAPGTGAPAAAEPAAPVPTTGTVRVTNLPAGAAIEADGQRQAGATFELAAGEHRIRVTAAGFEPMETPVTVDAGGAVTVPFAGQRIVQRQQAPPPQRRAEPAQTPPQRQQPAPSQTGVLRILIRPPGMLFIDGVNRGETARLEEQMPVGTHEIRVEKEGFQTIVRTVTIRADEPTTLRLNLEQR